MMFTALYYPHTAVRDPGLLKTGLLLWDRLEFIVPWPNYLLRSHDNNKEVDQALELIGHGLYPADEEKEQAHAAIEDLATSAFPKDFLWEKDGESPAYEIYPQKLLPKTWEILKASNLAVPGRGEFDDWLMQRNVGLAVMSILADACAGSQKRTVTDQSRSYDLLARSIAHIHGGEYGKVSETVTRLVTVAIKVVDADQFTLSELIEYRKQEQGASGHAARRLRHNFMASVDKYVERISGSEGRQGDIREIERQYELEMRDDMQNLKDLLKRKRTETLLSRDVGVGLLAAAGMAVTPWTIPSGILAIGALLKAGKGYKAERRDALSKHAMSWLFVLSQRGPIQWY